MPESTHPHIRAILRRYDFAVDDPYEALREILQEIVLYGLYDAGFFQKAVFYGGTALRMLYGLPRFSEDLDFSLLEEDPAFKPALYKEVLQKRLNEYGFDATIETKESDRAVKSGFVKANTLKNLIAIEVPEDLLRDYHPGKLVKIKFEVDTIPPGEFEWEEKLYMRPVPYMLKSMTPPSLFAGKMHALLCRGWEDRPKGRDWYDLVWYVARGTPLDLHHLASRLRQSCSVMERQNAVLPEVLDKEAIVRLLKKRIEALDFEMAKEDVARFVADPNELNTWNRTFFEAIAENLVVKRDDDEKVIR